MRVDLYKSEFGLHCPSFFSHEIVQHKGSHHMPVSWFCTSQPPEPYTKYIFLYKLCSLWYCSSNAERTKISSYLLFEKLHAENQTCSSEPEFLVGISISHGIMLNNNGSSESVTMYKNEKIIPPSSMNQAWQQTKILCNQRKFVTIITTNNFI